MAVLKEKKLAPSEGEPSKTLKELCLYNIGPHQALGRAISVIMALAEMWVGLFCFLYPNYSSIFRFKHVHLLVYKTVGKQCRLPCRHRLALALPSGALVAQ